MDSGRCAVHTKLEQRAYDDRRGSSAARGYGHRWRVARLAHLTHEPLCRECSTHGRVTQATLVDHIIPHKGDPLVFWDTTNWQSLCTPCHDAKRARESHEARRGAT
jgi:5-methylcytosine-specific restriction protein A